MIKEEPFINNKKHEELNKRNMGTSDNKSYFQTPDHTQRFSDSKKRSMRTVPMLPSY